MFQQQGRLSKMLLMNLKYEIKKYASQLKLKGQEKYSTIFKDMSVKIPYIWLPNNQGIEFLLDLFKWIKE